MLWVYLDHLKKKFGRNYHNFCFKIYRKGIFSGIGKALGMQDIKIGYDSFDDEFIIKGNNEELVKKIFLNNDIRSLIERQPKISLEAKDNKNGLSFTTVGVIKDVDRLKSLFELFTKVLDEFMLNGITIDQASEVELY